MHDWKKILELKLTLEDKNLHELFKHTNPVVEGD